MVQPHLLILESLLSLVQLVKAGLLPLTVVLVLQRFLISGCVKQSGLTLREAIIGVGAVDNIRDLLKDISLMPRVVGRRRHLAGGVLSTSSQLA
jgi:hypothetical protein